MLRLHLPPNFVAAVARNAVPLRVELDTGAPPPAELLPALALLQRWCGTPVPPKFIQLDRAKLSELAAAAGTQPIFVEDGQPTPWRHRELVARNESAGGQATEERQTAASPGRAAHHARPPSPSRPSAASALTVDGSEHFLAITLPSRAHPRYDEALALLKDNGFVLEPSNRRWWLRDRHRTLNFLAAHLTGLRDRFGAVFTPNFEKNTARLHVAEITVEVGAAGGGFAVTVGIHAGATPEPELRSAIAASRGYVEGADGIFLLDAGRLQKLAHAQQALAGDPHATVAPRRLVAVPPARAAELQAVLEEISPNFQPPDAWRERSGAVRNLSQLTPAPLAADLDARLRPYQRLGIAWLWHLRRHDFGGILADEMGLGKTLQALAMLSAGAAAPSRSADGSSGGADGAASSPERPASRVALVVCPASLLENWRREAARFTPRLRVFVHHGEQRLRDAAEFPGYDLIITSYGTLTRDQTSFSSGEFACVIADEAQHIKNRRSQNAAALRALRSRSRFVLTGTPVENSLDDLRSLFEFLLPGYLTRVPPGARGDERAWHDDRLRAQTAPYILRRTKRGVAPELPEKIEQVVWCELGPAQAALYRELQERAERELFDLESSGAGEARLKLAALTQLLRLRQVCCDPRLAAGARDPAESEPGPRHTGAAFADSAKLDAFRELLEEAIDDGHRVLVFSQFTSLLALLRPELETQGLGYCYLDGSMPPKARQAEVDRFQHTPDIPLFLLSLKAGGTGLNLTAADTVVHFDPWWNPAVEAQATDRAHRIGQQRTVTSYKLIAAGTVEEKVLGLQAEKRALLMDVFEASDTAAARLSLADLRELMR